MSSYELAPSFPTGYGRSALATYVHASLARSLTPFSRTLPPPSFALALAEETESRTVSADAKPFL